MKVLILSIFLLLSCEKEEPHSIFLYHASFWGGCVQGYVLNSGKTFGKASSLCKESAQKQTFKKNKYSHTSVIVDDSIKLFYKGCNEYNKNIRNCFLLTQNFEKDLKFIMNQDGRTK